MELREKFRILTEGAKYDVSCSSSGSDRAAKKGKSGLTNVGGVCHSFTADGRCISLLKILMTNSCIYNCRYCVNRSGADVERAVLTPDEICTIVMEFYKRNYIEGLFLSSAVRVSPDNTMELLVETVERLRNVYGFNGYIHLKAIPSADKTLIDRAAAIVDRMSVNIELPSNSGLKMLAPDKTREGIVEPMKQLSKIYTENSKRILPAGQTTQMIIGATPDNDGKIIRLSERLYRGLEMKRVYYSAYIPIGDDSVLPAIPPNLVRENRLYQADWLLRFYGFRAEEILPENMNLSLETDPKSAWALRNIDKFPVEINTADFEMLLRIPGIGVQTVNKILAARRWKSLTFEDLKRMRTVMKRAIHFITINGKYYGRGLDEVTLTEAVRSPEFAKVNYNQLTLFDSAKTLESPTESIMLLPSAALINSAVGGEV